MQDVDGSPEGRTINVSAILYADEPLGAKILLVAATYKGILLGESLRTDAVLEEIPLYVTRICRSSAGNVNSGQPELWTFIEFAVEAEHAEELAHRLRAVLDAQGGWYCDFRSDEEVFVVFADRIFRYPRGDRTERAKAEEYGRSVGVPDAQLDWPE